MGTCNVQGIYEERAVKTLTTEAKKYKMDLIALQEMHIKEISIIEVEEYILFRSGGRTGRYGVIFSVSKEIQEKCQNFVSLRQIKLYRIKG